jgi:hypothetical protein
VAHTRRQKRIYYIGDKVEGEPGIKAKRLSGEKKGFLDIANVCGTLFSYKVDF